MSKDIQTVLEKAGEEMIFLNWPRLRSRPIQENGAHDGSPYASL
jgi:hypothetical protein